MKRWLLIIALLAGVGLSLKLVLAQRFLVPGQAAQKPYSSQFPAADLIEARRLAWDAAVMVQGSPHSVELWQQAKVKWRQAIHLLESIPEGTRESTQAKQKLAVYRVNYAAISDRLTAEQTAIDNWQTAQTLAWQAAVTVQNPPYTLKVWQRASRRWDRAIALLEMVPPHTSLFRQSQEKLEVYRQNYHAISQRVTTEKTAIATVEKFAAIAKQLNELQGDAVSGLTIEQIGVSYQEYANLIKQQEEALNHFAKQPGATLHPAYPDLQAAIIDHKFALKLWTAYLDFKQQNIQWLYDDLLHHLIPVTLIGDSSLIKKYQLRTYSAGRTISLRFTIWRVWEHATDQVTSAQQKVIEEPTEPEAPQ